MITVELQEWQEATPADTPQLAAVELDEPSRALADQLTRQDVLVARETYAGLHLRARAHVGVVRLGPLTVSVRPKIPGDEMLDLFAYATRSTLRRFEPLPVNRRWSMIQLLAVQLLREIGDLLSRGLIRTYRGRHEALSTPRGRIDFAPLLRTNGELTSAALWCTHHVREPDHPLNQTLLAACDVARRLVRDRVLAAELGRLGAVLEREVSRKPLSPELLGRARRNLNRLTRAYAPAVELASALLDGCHFSLDPNVPDGRTAFPGFLFDMNRLFEDVLTRLLTENSEGKRVVTQRPLRGSLEYVDSTGAPLTPRPDFTVLRGDSATHILDAKYRDLSQHELTRDILYQMLAYLMLGRPESEEVAILYPTANRSAREERVRVHDPSGASGFVALRPVVLPQLHAAIRARDATARRTLAQRLLGTV